MLEKIPGMLLKIPGNAWEDFGDWYERLWGIFKKIPGNVAEDSGECSSRFQGMFGKILGNVQADSDEKMKNNNYWAIFLKKTNASLCLVTSLLSLIT